MALDYEDPNVLKKLTGAVEWSRRQLRSFQEQRMTALRQFVGKHYGDGGSDEKVPINLVNIFTQIYTRKLAVKKLRTLVTTNKRQLSPHAAEYTLVMNRILEQIKPESALNTAGQEAMFLMGLVQVGMSNDQVFVDPILFDDILLDMSAKRWDAIGFIGHRFRPSLDWARDNPQFDKKVRSKLAPTALFQANDLSDSEETQSQRLAMSSAGQVQEYRDRVDLIQLFCPEDKVLVTYAAERPTQPLSVVPWKGPPNSELGPYRKLGFIDVPGNLIPLAPVQLGRDIHDVVNRLGNKVFRQAERQKTLLSVPRKDIKDGDRIVKAVDGEAIPVDDGKEIREISTGGANQTTLGMVTWLRQLASYTAGNADAVGGLAPSSDTVGQDTMLLQSAGSQVEDMQQAMMQFTSDVCSDVAFWTLTDPLIDITLSRPIPGTDMSFDTRFTPDSIAGDFNEYDFKVDPYSSVIRTPQQRLQTLLGLTERVILQMLPIMQQNGQTLDVEKLVKLIAQYADLPEFVEIITFASGEAIQNPEDKPLPVPPPRARSDGGRPSSSDSGLGTFEKMMVGKMMGAGQAVGAA
jgi:hypothetical protein